jgi:predicted dehydrogenase
VLLPTLANLPGVRVVRTVSRRGLSARHAADKVGAQVAASLDEALAASDVDAVVIATRHDAHASQAARALEAGRDVFVEKPAAVDEEQLAMLSRAVRAASARLLVGFNRRFSPFATAVRDAFAGRRAGLAMTARINAGRVPSGSWIVDEQEGGGRVIGEVCHFVDLFGYWAGARPVRVSAHAIGAGGGYERDDNLAVGLSFSDGSVATLLYSSMGDSAAGKERYEVLGEGKLAVIDDWRTLSITSRGRTKTTRSLRPDKGHNGELRAFAQACRNGTPSPIPWDSIESTTRATFAIERAWREGTVVDLCADS